MSLPCDPTQSICDGVAEPILDPHNGATLPAMSAGCTQAMQRERAEYAVDYEPAGVDEEGRTHFRALQHAGLTAQLHLYYTEPSARFSPSRFSEWVFSRERSEAVYLGDPNARAPDLILRVSDQPSLKGMVPFGTHAWQQQQQASTCQEASARGAGATATRAWVRIECVLCATGLLAGAAAVGGGGMQSRPLEPLPVRTGCSSIDLRWPAPRPPYWGIDVPPPERYRLRVAPTSADSVSTSVWKTGVVELTVMASQQSALNFAHVEGLTSGTSYEFRLAPSIGSTRTAGVPGAISGAISSVTWGAYGPPVVLTTGVSSDLMMVWPLELTVVLAPPATRRGRSVEGAPPPLSCRALHFLVPPPPDCQGFTMEMEWLLPSVQDHDRASSLWQPCSACTIGTLTADGQRVVTVAGVSPLALYEFRAKLVRRNAMPLSPSAGAETAPSEERFGPATPPVLAGWIPTDLLAAPTVHATSSASFELIVPRDPAAQCRQQVGQPIDWEVEVRQRSQAGSALHAAAATWLAIHRSDILSVQQSSASASTSHVEISRVEIHSLRCPSGCDFRLRPTNVMGAAAHAAAYATASSPSLPPRRTLGADRIELKLQQAPLTGTRTSTPMSGLVGEGGVSSKVAEGEQAREHEKLHALEQQFNDEMVSVLQVRRESVHLVEPRASLRYVIVDLAPGLARTLVDALRLRAQAFQCVPTHMVERLWSLRAAAILCERLRDAPLLSHIDLSGGVLLQSVQDASIWIQLAPTLVRDEGILIEQTADVGGGSDGGAIALALLVLVLVVPIAAAYFSSIHNATASARVICTTASSAGAEALITVALGLEDLLARVLPAEVCDWWRRSGRPACSACAQALGEAARERWWPAMLAGYCTVVSRVAHGADMLRGRLGTSRMGRLAPGSSAVPTSAEEGADLAEEDAGLDNSEDGEEEEEVGEGKEADRPTQGCSEIQTVISDHIY